MRQAWMIERSLQSQPEHRRQWHVLFEESGFESRRFAQEWIRVFRSLDLKYHYRAVLYVPKGKK